MLKAATPCVYPSTQKLIRTTSTVRSIDVKKRKAKAQQNKTEKMTDKFSDTTPPDRDPEQANMPPPTIKISRHATDSPQGAKASSGPRATTQDGAPPQASRKSQPKAQALSPEGKAKRKSQQQVAEANVMKNLDLPNKKS